MERRWIHTFFEHGSNALIVALILVLTGVLLASGRVVALAPTVLGGVGLFTVVEYLTHRFLLHARPASNRFLLAMQRRLHYDHHVQPDRLDLLFLPPWFLVPVVATYGTLYYLLTQDTAVACALLLGNMLGLLHYERVHFVAHIPVTPGSAFGRYMKKYHLWHHYKNENLWFGVTHPTFDLLFGTYRNPVDTEKSATTRNLHGNAS